MLSSFISTVYNIRYHQQHRSAWLSLTYYTRTHQNGSYRFSHTCGPFVLTFHYLIQCVLPVNEPGGNYISFLEWPFETNLPVLRCPAMQQQRSWHTANGRASDMHFGLSQTSCWCGRVPLELHSSWRRRKISLFSERYTHTLPLCIETLKMYMKQTLTWNQANLDSRTWWFITAYLKHTE